ncbi:unnamed protein product [Diatraea saccharalis]|uniref:Uncharacterized protein n=1 Tax=Diatraea saccharalis TaxID=40085 RepID=A0A9N9QXH4_9NEOP|nr:unnamed protein product [Diatraea saccharalis]
MCDCAEEQQRRLQAEREREELEREAAKAQKSSAKGQKRSSAKGGESAQKRSTKSDAATQKRGQSAGGKGHLGEGAGRRRGSNADAPSTPAWVSVLGGTLLMALLGFLAKTGSDPEGWARPLHSCLCYVGKSLGSYCNVQCVQAADLESGGDDNDDCDCEVDGYGDVLFDDDEEEDADEEYEEEEEKENVALKCDVRIDSKKRVRFLFLLFMKII